jgi:IS4 transposase
MFINQEVAQTERSLEHARKVILANNDPYRGLIKPDKSAELIQMIERAEQKLKDNFDLSSARDCLNFVCGALWILDINYKY